MYSAMIKGIIIIVASVITCVIGTEEEKCQTAECYLGSMNEFIGSSMKWTYPDDNRGGFGNVELDRPAEFWGSFDFIVVGAGSSGSVVSARLSEDPKTEVLVLEAGGEENEMTDIPAMAAHLQHTDYNWGYKSVPQKSACLGMKDGRCTCPRGKAIGGSSVINYMMYSRPSKEDFDQWGASCPNFLFENVLPYFKKSEKADMENVDTDYHGLSGPLSVEHVKFDTPLTNVFIAGNKEMGMKEVDYNGNESLGVSKLQITTVKGRRCSTGKAFVTPSRKRKNFHLIDKTLVTKILIDQAKATGVEFFRNGRKYSANATKEVIISAGSINTPQLLILSGIGPKQELDRLKIPAVMDLSVGRNLHDHPAYLAVYFGTNITVENVDVIGIANDYIQGKGLLTTGMGVTGLGFVPFKNSQKPNIEYIFLSILVDDNLEAYYKNSMQVTDETYAALLGPLKGNKLAIGFVVVLEQPKSVGSITLRSNSPLDFPDIDFNYYSDENGDDLNQMVQGIKSLFALVQTEEFRKIGTNYLSAPFPPCSSLEHLSDDYWTCALKQLTTTLYHPVGTSKMGTGSDSVVDCDFKVRGVGRLRVVDASVAPYSLAGHTNALAIMIGEMAADVIKSQH